MKIIFAVALAMIALPVYAQGQKPPPGIPDTAPSTSSDPSTGPRARDGALSAPAPLAHYPICKRGQFDKCMEPGNGAGKAHHMRHRRHR